MRLATSGEIWPEPCTHVSVEFMNIFNHVCIHLDT